MLDWIQSSYEYRGWEGLLPFIYAGVLILIGVLGVVGLLLQKAFRIPQRSFLIEAGELADGAIGKFNYYLILLVSYCLGNIADPDALEEARRAADYALRKARRQINLLDTYSSPEAAWTQLALAEELNMLLKLFPTVLAKAEEYVHEHPDLASDQRLELIEQLQGAIDDLQPIQEITKGRVERFIRKYRIGVTFRGAIQCVIRTTDIVAAIEQENMARTGEASPYDESWA